MHSGRAIIISGVKGSGKTTKLQEINKLLVDNGIAVAGIIAVAGWENGERNNYTLVDVTTGKSAVLCSAVQSDGFSKHGNFYFNSQAIKFGEKILLEQVAEKRVIIIDEVGPFEMKGEIWHSSVRFQLDSTNNIVLMAVRESLVSDVKKKYKIESAIVYNTNSHTGDIANKIMSKMS